MKKGIGCGVLTVLGPVLGCLGLMVLVVVIIFSGVGSILGWLFGGGPPNGTPGPVTPGGPPRLATPTPVPVSCYITPTPVVITLPPNTPQPTATYGFGSPSPTAVNTPTPALTSLPTSTPCPTSNLLWTPTPPGANAAFYPLARGVGAGGVASYNPITAPTIGLTTFTNFLSEMGSPALAEAESMYGAIVQEGGDPAIALAFFEHESSGGKAGVAVYTHSLGNLRCTPGYSCYHTEGNGAFRSYPNWTEGGRDWTRLMAHYYRDELGLTTLEQILPVYAPTSDGNAPASYLQGVKSRVDQLRRQEWEYGPHNSPYHAPYVVTQEYGCTSFREFADADCAASSGGTKPYFHRGVDLVGLGDKTIYATLSGSVDYAGEGEDGFGMRVYLRKGPYLVIYAHLSRLLVTTGQAVQEGQPLGVEGSSGYSTGSHLHYEVHVGGQWVDSAPFLLPLGNPSGG